MTNQPPHWGKLERSAPVAQDARNAEFAELCAAAFTTPSGRLLLAELHRRYIDDVLNTTVTDSALVVHNAKRHLVRELEQQTAHGLQLRSAKKE